MAAKITKAAASHHLTLGGGNSVGPPDAQVAGPLNKVHLYAQESSVVSVPEHDPTLWQGEMHRFKGEGRSAVFGTQDPVSSLVLLTYVTEGKLDSSH